MLLRRDEQRFKQGFSGNEWFKDTSISYSLPLTSLCQIAFYGPKGTRCYIKLYEGFHKWWYPKNGWFIMENPTKIAKWMIWGYPHFRKPPFALWCSWCTMWFDVPIVWYCMMSVWRFNPRSLLCGRNHNHSGVGTILSWWDFLVIRKWSTLANLCFTYMICVFYIYDMISYHNQKS